MSRNLKLKLLKHFYYTLSIFSFRLPLISISKVSILRGVSIEWSTGSVRVCWLRSRSENQLLLSLYLSRHEECQLLITVLTGVDRSIVSYKWNNNILINDQIETNKLTFWWWTLNNLLFLSQWNIFIREVSYNERFFVKKGGKNVLSFPSFLVKLRTRRAT